MKTNTGIVLAVGAGALWLLTRPKKASTTPPGPSPGVPRPAVVKGSLGTIRLDQGARMGATAATPAEKAPGEFAYITIPLLGLTTNAAGTRIEWPYALWIRIGHTTLLGWKTIDQLFPSYAGDVTTETYNVLAGATEIRGFAMPKDPGQLWDVKVHLMGKVSQQDGNPSNQWQDLDTGDLFGAFKTIDVRPTPAAVKGALGTISVAQARRQRVYVRGHFRQGESFAGVFAGRR